MSAVQKHGADSYLADGRASGALDFSSTVVQVPPPAGWRRRFLGRLDSLRRYPQPYALGLAGHLEKRLGLPPGSVLVGNGSSECLAWIAQALRGKRVLLETPCFGEYAVWLARHGALLREIGADEPWSPDWQRLKLAAAKSQCLWLADPANPSGLKMSEVELRERAAFCRAKNVLLVLDEALRAQTLRDPGDLGLKLATRSPGMLLLRSMSKGLGLPGLRLGFIVGHPKEIAKLGPLVDPWNVNSLAQALGPWIFDEELRQGAGRRKTLGLWKQDLLRRLAQFPMPQRMKIREADTGFFLVRLLGPMDDSVKLASSMAKQGLLLRSCASYGGWGRGYLRLNPRSPSDNARLLAGLKKYYAAL